MTECEGKLSRMSEEMSEAGKRKLLTHGVEKEKDG